MGWHIAGAAWVGVVAPGTANVTRALVEHEVRFVGLDQTHRCGDAREAGSDDRNTVVRNELSRRGTRSVFSIARRLVKRGGARADSNASHHLR